MEFNRLIFCPAALMKNRDILTPRFYMLSCSNIQPSLLNHYVKAEWPVSRLADTVHLLSLLFSVSNVKEKRSKNRPKPCNWITFLSTQLDHGKWLNHLKFFYVVQSIIDVFLNCLLFLYLSIPLSFLKTLASKKICTFNL